MQCVSELHMVGAKACAVCLYWVKLSPTWASSCLLMQEQEAVHEELGFPPVRRPVQSHCLSNMQRLALHHSQASLMVQHLPGTVR